MGKHFGNLQRLKGVTYYCISPNELRTFTGFFNPGFKNLLRKISDNILIISVPATLVGLFLKYGIDVDHHSHLKNPDDYQDDV